MSTFGGLSIGAILGYFAKGLVDHFLIKDRAREERRLEQFNQSAKALRSAFADEIAILRSAACVDIAETYNILKEAFPRHERAVFEFGEALNKNKKARFLSAWENYYYPAEMNIISPEKEVQTYMLAQYLSVNDEEETEYKAAALDRIQTVLSFAAQK